MNHKCDTDERVCFYEQEFYVLSNFSAFAVKIAGVLFPTTEHAYHWHRFFDLKVREKILNARSAHLAFTVAQCFKHCQISTWDDMKVAVMAEIIRAKAEQHEYVRRKLFETGNRMLVEDSWRDDFWGWGPNKDGQNMLGVLWMQLRDDLRSKGWEDFVAVTEDAKRMED